MCHPLIPALDKPATSRKVKRDIELEVEREHGGDYRRYLEHTFKKEMRETPHHKRSDLHERWFSSDLKKWFEAHKNVDINYGGLRRSLNVSEHKSLQI